MQNINKVNLPSDEEIQAIISSLNNSLIDDSDFDEELIDIQINAIINRIEHAYNVCETIARAQGRIR